MINSIVYPISFIRKRGSGEPNLNVTKKILEREKMMLVFLSPELIPIQIHRDLE